MTAPKVQELCPDCDREVSILPTRGGRGTNGMTEYGVTCKCGLVVDHLGSNGTHRSAVSGWNQWARQRRATNPPPPQRSRTRDAAPKVRLTRPERTGEVYVKQNQVCPSYAPKSSPGDDRDNPLRSRGVVVPSPARRPVTAGHRSEEGEKKPTPDSLLAAWLQLDAADRKRALALMSLEQTRAPKGDDRDLDMWAEALYEALAAAIGPSDGPAHGVQVIKRSVAPHAFWDPVREFMDVSKLATYSPAHRLAAYRVLAGIVVKRAKDIAHRTSAPMGPKLVATCSQQVAGLFENNFPGYLKSGLAPVIVRQMIKPGEAPPHDEEEED